MTFFVFVLDTTLLNLVELIFKRINIVLNKQIKNKNKKRMKNTNIEFPWYYVDVWFNRLDNAPTVSAYTRQSRTP